MEENWYHEQLKQQDVRLTDGRELILSILSENSGDHLTVEELYMKAYERNPSIGMATIYRTVDLLVNLGLAQRFEFGEGKARYELVPRPDEPGHHHHIICKNCKRIINYDDFMEEEKEFLELVEQGLSERYNFEIEDHMIQFYGYCRDCDGADE